MSLTSTGSAVGAKQGSAQNNVPQPTGVNAQAVLATRSLFIAAAVVSILLASVALYSVFISMLAAQTSLLSSTALGHECTYAARSVRMLTYLLIVVAFVALRLGTLRIYSSSDANNNTNSVFYGAAGAGGVAYNHRETDERVFEVRTVTVQYILSYHVMCALHDACAVTYCVHPRLFAHW